MIIKHYKNDIFRIIINDDYGNHKLMMMMIIVMMMEILQCHLFIIHRLKINEYTCKHKFYMMYEMYNMNMINEISPLTSSS